MNVEKQYLKEKIELPYQEITEQRIVTDVHYKTGPEP